MRVKPVTPDMLAAILPWWEARGVGAMPADVLPPCGNCAVGDAGEPLAAAWLYQPPGCRVAILDWLVSKPGIGGIRTRAACRAVFRSLADTARAGGARLLFASVERAGMLREAQACGFTIAASGCTHLVKHL